MLPVKDSRSTLLSSAIARPISAPPATVLHMAPGKLLADKTCPTIFATARQTRGAVGGVFLQNDIHDTCCESCDSCLATNHKVVLPHTRLRAWFQPKTATGKLNAFITPTTPSGFHCSNRAWPGPGKGVGLDKHINKKI